MTTLCSQVYNRNSFLEQTLPTWLLLDLSEIIIVNWYTENKFPFYNDPRIKLVNILEDKPYSLSQAKNIAFRLASFSTIFYFDCDIKVTDKFPKISDIEISEKFFYMGKTREIDPVNGSLIFTKNQLESVNGFNECLVGYGHEDIDYLERLQKKGYEWRFLPEGLEHIHHSNVLRGESFEEKDIFLSALKNILRAEDHPWTLKDVQKKFRVSVQTTKGTIDLLL
jgi:predicted glycosyltransferase involved in capsule biosynthesis